MIEIIFVVLMIMALILHPWPNSPLAAWTWGGGLINWLLFACLGLAVFGFHVVR